MPGGGGSTDPGEVLVKKRGRALPSYRVQPFCRDDCWRAGCKKDMRKETGRESEREERNSFSRVDLGESRFKINHKVGGDGKSRKPTIKYERGKVSFREMQRINFLRKCFKHKRKGLTSPPPPKSRRKSSSRKRRKMDISRQFVDL